VVAVPKPPAALPVQAGGKKAGVWASYAPLIVILNLLLLAAVSLVLYFLFKN
jgi:hypothetical protein